MFKRYKVTAGEHGTLAISLSRVFKPEWIHAELRCLHVIDSSDSPLNTTPDDLLAASMVAQ